MWKQRRLPPCVTSSLSSLHRKRERENEGEKQWREEISTAGGSDIASSALSGATTLTTLRLLALGLPASPDYNQYYCRKKAWGQNNKRGLKTNQSVNKFSQRHKNTPPN